MAITDITKIELIGKKGLIRNGYSTLYILQVNELLEDRQK